VTEEQFQVLRLCGFVFALGLATSLQAAAPYAPLRGSWRTNGFLWGLNGVLMAVACGGCACSVARWAGGQGVGALNAVPLPLEVTVAVTVLALDFVSYCWHRANHQVPVLWRFHRVHHSDQSFTASTGLRFHPGELVLSLPLRIAAIAVLGAPVVGVLAFEILFTVSNLAEHGNIRLPRRLERQLAVVCVTPALHRRHHSREVVALNSNFGTIFTWWDRLFATYGASSSKCKVRTGVAGVEQPLTVLGALALPFDR
jgi:sterol desaturase/sphingolipid hydroxylase (fatty acid hydroxylase superfamily)